MIRLMDAPSGALIVLHLSCEGEPAKGDEEPEPVGSSTSEAASGTRVHQQPSETLARFRRRAMLVVLTELVEQAVSETLLPALP
jgi:hypothetical protein